jgi:hypothetical protein
MMSWNWLVSTVFQQLVEFGERGYGPSGEPEISFSAASRACSALAVDPLHLRLGGVGGAVQFEVELAFPDGVVGAVGDSSRSRAGSSTRRSGTRWHRH